MEPSALEKVSIAVADTEFEGKVFAVGGYVRDRLLGLAGSHDIDLVVEGDALALADLLWLRGVAETPPATYANFGTAQVRIDDSVIELVMARRESYRGDSRKPSTVPATLTEDAERRDFTVNTLLLPVGLTSLMDSLPDSPSPLVRERGPGSEGARATICGSSGMGDLSSHIQDPLGTGLSDLLGRILRTPRDPLLTFEDDPLRMLRAVRFAHQLGFQYAPGLEDAIQAKAHRMSILSPERIREELMKMLAGPAPAEALADLMRLGLLPQFWPEFAEGIGMEQGTYHHLDVWAHTLAVVKAARSDPWIRLACLFHDVGKPTTRTVEASDRIRFFQHEVVGAELAHEMMGRLRFSHDETAFVVKMVRNHMRLGSMKTFTAAAARRLIRDLGNDLEALLDVCDADAAGLKQGVRILDVQAIRREIEAVAVQTPAKSLESPLTGSEIIDWLGGTPGPWVGQVKRDLSDQVIAGHIAPGDKHAARLFLTLGEGTRSLGSGGC